MDKEQADIIASLAKCKRQARQMSSNAVVVPWGKAMRVIKRLVEYNEKKNETENSEKTHNG